MTHATERCAIAHSEREPSPDGRAPAATGARPSRRREQKHKTSRAKGRPRRTRGLAMVGATGFEPATSCSRSRRATGLRYAPPNGVEPLERLVHAPVGIRTPNLLIRSQMLYPVELRALTTHRIAIAGRPDADPKNRPRAGAGQPDRGRTAPGATCMVFKTKPPAHCRGQPYGRYKTRTCDLHDVNVAL